MNPDDRIVDLVERTLANLRTMDDLAADRTATYKPFEVTQMVNSLLSLLVVPRELGTVAFVGQASGAHIRLDGIHKWHRGPVQFELREIGRKPPEHLKKLLGGLRNSVAHADFEFYSDLPRGPIRALTFTSCARDGTSLWSITFKVTELRKFLDNLGLELVEARKRQLASSHVSENPRSQQAGLEISLPLSSLRRIEKLVADHEAKSVGQFIEEAVEVKLRDDEDVAAA